MFNNENKELIVGSIAFVVILLIFYLILGVFFIYLAGISLIFAAIAIYLFSRKNIFAKFGSMFVYEGIILKVLMPSKYRKEINSLKNENKNET